MNRKDEILAELRSLIDEQTNLLKNRLTPEQAGESVLRKRKIEELLDQISANHHEE